MAKWEEQFLDSLAEVLKRGQCCYTVHPASVGSEDNQGELEILASSGY